MKHVVAMSRMRTRVSSFHPNIIFHVPSPPAPRMQVTKGVFNTSQLRRKGMVLARCAEIRQEIQ